MSIASTQPRRHRVVVIGSGFGGLFGTQALKRADVDITLIARTTHHLFQPLLYQVATGILSVGDIAPATRMVLRKQKNAEVLLGDVETIDLKAGTVTSRLLDRTTVTEFDSLIVAAGAGQSYFGNDHFAEFAPGMKTIDDALELRGRILGAFEQAEFSDDPEERARLLTFVVVGAGPTGVELAGQIAELAHRTLQGAFRRDQPERFPGHPPRRRPRRAAGVRREAEPQGRRAAREARRGDPVERDGRRRRRRRGSGRADKDGDRRRIESQCKVWSAGVQASPLGKQLGEQSGAEVDRAGRVHVNPDLTLPGYPDVFVIGDMMALDKLPGLAQVAMQGGEVRRQEIKGGLAGRPPTGSRSSTSTRARWRRSRRFSAVAQVGKLGSAASSAGWRGGDPPDVPDRVP